jgi:hypothetical protein
VTTYLHIGPPKTGTTFVQNVLAHNRDLLRGMGVCYPGERGDHFFAARDLLAPVTGLEPQAPGSWAEVVEEARAWTGSTVVISHEHFRLADPPTIDRIAQELGPDLQVIVTARDFARQVCSLWQETVKERNTLTFGTTLTRLHNQLGHPSRPLGPVARTIDVARVLEQWGKVLSPSDIHLVTMPRGEGSRLWDRFAEVVGVDPTAFDTDVPLNRGMGIGATELVRRLNESLECTDLEADDYEQLVKHRLAGEMLAGDGGERITLPRSHHAWLTEWAREQVEALRSAGYQVTGDLEDLVPGPATDGHVDATPEQVADAAVSALHHLVLEWADLVARTTALEEHPPPTSLARALLRKVRPPDPAG